MKVSEAAGHRDIMLAMPVGMSTQSGRGLSNSIRDRLLKLGVLRDQ
jgi:hypothetical protein